MPEDFSHLSAQGQARMVDVSGKTATRRRAVAEGVLQVSAQLLEKLLAGAIPKGDVWAAARIAAVMGAKRTSDFIPLCHPLRLSSVEVHIGIRRDRAWVVVQTQVVAEERTGVEMEALVGTTHALLTLYDMVKGFDKSPLLGPVRLLRKSGGKSGDFEAPEASWLEGAEMR